MKFLALRRGDSSAQVTCWTFIIQYGTRVFMAEGMEEKAAEILSQKYNIVAMVLFTLSRFICTFFLKYIDAGRLLSILAVIAGVAVSGVVMFTDRNGLYCLVAVSGCMSLMFPTIYGIALKGPAEADFLVVPVLVGDGVDDGGHTAHHLAVLVSQELGRLAILRHGVLVLTQ